jgi:hypothetical protein
MRLETNRADGPPDTRTDPRENGETPEIGPTGTAYFERDFLSLAGSDSGTATAPVGIPNARNTASKN